MDGIQPYAAPTRPPAVAHPFPYPSPYSYTPPHPQGVPNPAAVKTPSDYVRALRRRVWLVLMVAVRIVAFVGVVGALGGGRTVIVSKPEPGVWLPPVVLELLFGPPLPMSSSRLPRTSKPPPMVIVPGELPGARVPLLPITTLVEVSALIVPEPVIRPPDAVNRV